jgi:hypothetical protein
LNSGKWIEFADENSIPQREEDITKLSGGGKLYGCLFQYSIFVLLNSFRNTGL